MIAPVLGQNTTETGVNLIKHFESFRAEPYYCSAGVYTVGYGSTGEHVKPGMVLSEQEATILLYKDLIRFEDHVKKKVSRRLRWNEFDALVSFTFNVGYRIKGDIQRAINTGNTELVIFHLSKFNKAKVKGVYKVLPGLVRRRRSESILYKTGVLQFK